jgi:hypothetical protein
MQKISQFWSSEAGQNQANCIAEAYTVVIYINNEHATNGHLHVAPIYLYQIHNCIRKLYIYRVGATLAVLGLHLCLKHQFFCVNSQYLKMYSITQCLFLGQNLMTLHLFKN